ncbi:MAG: hypothetical protein Q8S73_10370 [Deltaproteobacteria bacterium]|nr:hypothetical protein [Myxococcales bacterium]MDP3214497.1 hypothetical protein [Deltaproteobacteria bacterium]
MTTTARIHHGRRLRVALLGALALGGCVVFDPSLYQQDTAGITLADRCENAASIPTIQPELQRLVQVDTTGLGDQYREFAACTGNDLPGNEGFFAVTMHPGETWHFHVDPVTPDSDPAIYVLPVCTTLQCSTAGASDLCGPGRSEHFSFRPVTDGVHLIGIDSKVRGGAAYAVTVVRPVCGNGTIEHGEPCDDALPQAEVTCERCHKVLTRAMATEVGVANDDYVNAMVLRPAGGAPLQSFAVQGTVGGCDLDMFSFDAAEGDAITARLTPLNGATCPAGLSLSLQRSDIAVPPAHTDVPAPVSEAMVTMTDGCPSVTLPRAARASTWFLQVTVRPAPATEFPYALTVDARRP